MKNNILCLDPSSTIIGYALMSISADLLEAGLIRPDRPKDHPLNRIDTLCRDLTSLLEEILPYSIIIETTCGKVNLRRHRGRGAGLAVYGMGVGEVRRLCLIWGRQNTRLIYCYDENEWTGGKNKKQRAHEISLQYHQYRRDLDPGLDIADAIGLGVYHIKHKKS